MKSVIFSQKVKAGVLIVALIGLFIFTAIVGHANKSTDILTQVESILPNIKTYELIAEFNDGKVQLYRTTYMNATKLEICYVAIGYLHGYTIALDCEM